MSLYKILAEQSDLLEKCGGPGSGVPGPCPGGGRKPSRAGKKPPKRESQGKKPPKRESQGKKPPKTKPEKPAQKPKPAEQKPAAPKTNETPAQKSAWGKVVGAIRGGLEYTKAVAKGIAADLRAVGVAAELSVSKLEALTPQMGIQGAIKVARKLLQAGYKKVDGHLSQFDRDVEGDMHRIQV
jgi:hypothetical protein